jgi:hypothetical protein
MPTALKDREFLRAGVAELEDYLRSDELFWPLDGNVDFPRLTVGGLLLALKRLNGWNVPAHERVELDSLENLINTSRSKWRTAWEKKATREVHARFDLWKNYLADYRQSPDGNAPDYPQQVRERAQLDLLASALSVPPVDLLALKDLDRFLRQALLPGAFVWEAELVPAFPAEEFWYLYGKLKA